MIVFIGPSGAGKSRLGKRVARLLDVPYADTDKMIVADHGPIPDIFRQHGEPHFRDLERQAVVRGLTGDGVLSLGGGAILDPATQADLDDHTVVFLTITPEAVAERIAGDTDRPLVAGFHAVGDCHTATNPLYGRGCSLAMVQAQVLADLLSDATMVTDHVARATAYEKAVHADRKSVV